LCAVRDEERLERAAEKLERKGIRLRRWREPDIDQLTAIATEPISGDARRYFKDFQLLKGDHDGYAHTVS